MVKRGFFLFMALVLVSFVQATPNLDMHNQNLPKLQDESVVNNEITYNNLVSMNSNVNINNQINIYGTLIFINNTPQPSCTESKRGSLFFVRSGLGVKDGFQICIKTILDTYVWVDIDLI